MISPRFLVAIGLVILIVIAPGCGSYSSDPADGPGLTEAELKKMMADAAADPPPPRVMELTAEETMELLTNPTTAATVSDSLKSFRRRVIGKVLEVSPDKIESLYLVLDGGKHNDRAYQVKCNLAADQREALKGVRAGDEVRLEGTSDGVLSDVTLEFQECVFDSPTKSTAAPSSASP